MGGDVARYGRTVAGRAAAIIAPIIAPPGGFAGPAKRSVTIAGHQTSISLEPVFWAALETAATARALPLNALIAEIDAIRIKAEVPPNLASALRSWLFCHSGENYSQ